jgi:hypothetical protein
MIKISPLREDEGKEKSDGRCQGVQEGPTEVTSFDLLYLLISLLDMLNKPHDITQPKHDMTSCFHWLMIDLLSHRPVQYPQLVPVTHLISICSACLK